MQPVHQSIGHILLALTPLAIFVALLVLLTFYYRRKDKKAGIIRKPYNFNQTTENATGFAGQSKIQAVRPRINKKQQRVYIVIFIICFGFLAYANHGNIFAFLPELIALILIGLFSRLFRMGINRK